MQLERSAIPAQEKTSVDVDLELAEFIDKSPRPSHVGVRTYQNSSYHSKDYHADFEDTRQVSLQEDNKTMRRVR